MGVYIPYIHMKLDFTETVDDSILLLDYAARNGVAVDEKIKKILIGVDETVKANQPIAEDDQIQFWTAFTEISKLLRPVDSNSIRYTQGEDVRGIATRRYQVPIYIVLSILVLLSLILVQAYWVGGNSLVTDVGSNIEEFADLQHKITTKESTSPVSEAEVSQMYARLRNVFARLTSDHTSLHAWNLMWAEIPGMNAPFEENSATYESLDVITRAHVDLASAKMFLEGSYRYFLPLMYGLLGSCFYVLRTMAREIKSWTFNQQSSIAYLLRITLGPLAGLAVSLFMIEDANIILTAVGSNGIEGNGATSDLISALGGFGPLAAAFIVGYGVELLFAFMDRIVNAFTVARD